MSFVPRWEPRPGVLSLRPERLPPMEHEAEFAKGDRVQAKGGFGPVMTVEEVYAPIFKYRFRCVWQDAEGKFLHELFRAEGLQRVE